MAPVPNRGGQSHKHLTRAEIAEREGRKAPGATEVSIPEPGDWHPRVIAFYKSLAESGQSRFYEPSDWQLAVLCCEFLDRAIGKEDLNARALGEVTKMLRDLMVTEGARRKLHLELQRPVGGFSSLDGDDTPALAVIEDYRNKITG